MTKFLQSLSILRKKICELLDKNFYEGFTRFDKKSAILTPEHKTSVLSQIFVYITILTKDDTLLPEPFPTQSRLLNTLRKLVF